MSQLPPAGGALRKGRRQGDRPTLEIQFCHRGHDRQRHGYFDAAGYQRCRLCTEAYERRRQIQAAELRRKLEEAIDPEGSFSKKERPRGLCSVADCPNLEEFSRGRRLNGLCYGHRYRLKRGLPISEPLSETLGHKLSPWQMLHDAALEVAAADDDAEYKLACGRLKTAAKRFMRATEGDTMGNRSAKAEKGEKWAKNRNTLGAQQLSAIRNPPSRPRKNINDSRAAKGNEGRPDRKPEREAARLAEQARSRVLVSGSNTVRRARPFELPGPAGEVDVRPTGDQP